LGGVDLIDGRGAARPGSARRHSCASSSSSASSMSSSRECPVQGHEHGVEDWRLLVGFGDHPLEPVRSNAQSWALFCFGAKVLVTVMAPGSVRIGCDRLRSATGRCRLFMEIGSAGHGKSRGSGARQRCRRPAALVTAPGFRRREKGRGSDLVPRLGLAGGRLNRLALARDGHRSPAIASPSGRRNASDEEVVTHQGSTPSICRFEVLR